MVELVSHCAPPMLLAAAAGIALSASGCIIDSSNDGCPPDLTISWLLTSNSTASR